MSLITCEYLNPVACVTRLTWISVISVQIITAKTVEQLLKYNQRLINNGKTYINATETHIINTSTTTVSNTVLQTVMQYRFHCLCD